ncbi:nuclear transport factor 2 family protein [Streptomyces sp. NK08204]|uniref:nuclear transport factor 2 family protein n=1 Tax=Streptomyces sp. NK08204 TaxID=2873260 RepID=UPI001CED23D8|nr:nuclear transport factor 2 family protein [Streptomyces sp. NK08204]
MTTTSERESVLATLERFFAAEAAYLAAGGPGHARFDEMAACLTPDVVLYQAESLPYGGVYRGPAGVERFMAEMSRYWSSLEFLEQRFVVDADSAVVFNHGMLTARDSGRQLETSVMQLITVRGDRISEFRPFYWDSLAVARTLGSVRVG